MNRTASPSCSKSACPSWRRRFAVCLLTCLCFAPLAGCEDAARETTLTLGSETASVGSDVARPDWLPAWFELPENLQINAAATDPKLAISSIYGVVSGQEAPQLAAKQIAMFRAQGYELTPRSDSQRIKATHTDGTLIELRVEPYGQAGVLYRLQLHGAQSADALRARELATAIEGTGTLSAEIAGQRFELTGPCRVEGRYVKFTSASGDTELYADGRSEPQTLRGNLARSQGQAFSAWTPTPAAPDGRASRVTVSAQGFSYQGGLFEVLKSAPVSGRFEMVCRG